LGFVCATLNRPVLKSFFLLWLKADFTLVSLTLNRSGPTAGMNVSFIEEEKLQEELCSAAAF